MLTKLLHKLVFVVLGLLMAILVQRFAPKLFPQLSSAFSKIPPISALPSPVRDWLKKFISMILGLLIGIFFHYLIYRFTLPVKPFVYVAF
jgi:hypothetical protein